MRSIVKIWEPNENYWELHPVVKTIPEFNKFYSEDKSKNKDVSSRIMWAIAFYVDQHENNTWKNVLEEDKIKLIEEDYMKGYKFSFNDSKIKHLAEVYLNTCMTIPEKELYILIKKLQERSEFIKNTPYSLDYFEETDKGYKKIKGTAEQLDKMITGTYNIYKQIDQITKNIQEDANKGATRGGVTESASEKGLM